MPSERDMLRVHLKGTNKLITLFQQMLRDSHEERPLPRARIKQLEIELAGTRKAGEKILRDLIKKRPIKISTK